METTELLETIVRGEDSRHQFKDNATNATSLAAEIAAFANSGGGQIFIGVADDGGVHELAASDVRRLNRLISSTASVNVRPAINPRTENVSVGRGVVVVVTIPDGLSNPYVDNSGVIWVKNGSDKRRVTAREEMQRMFQSAQLVHGDDVPIPGTSASDIDVDYFRKFFTNRFGTDLDEQGLSLTQILANMRLLSQGMLTVSGALLFASDPTPLVPAFHIKAVCYPGTDIHSSRYADSADIYGRIESQFEQSLSFVVRNLRREQREQGVNSEGIPEVPRIVFEELLANAIIHRDFFVSAPIRIFIFDDRIEIISPGHLPNNLTVDNIRCGNSNMRNPILASYATKVLPYRGLGNGIVRAIKEYPRIDFCDDRDGNRFVAIVRRPKASVAAS
jgi:predicted HTH transcriptional regulator